MTKKSRKDTIEESTLAAQYGFALATLHSDKELSRWFNKAVAESWTPDRMQAELRATDWYQKHSDTWRKAVAQKAADPQTYSSQVAQVKTRIAMMASEYGAVISGKTLSRFAENAYQLGWDDNQVRSNLGTYVNYTSKGTLTGAAAGYDDDIRSYARAMGVRLADSTILSNVRHVVEGRSTLDTVKATIQKTAASAFPQFADRLAAGETLADIASPYQQTMATILEVNPQTLDVYDPTIRSALSSKTPDGKPAAKTLYDFEQDLRSDKRWLKTNNARDSLIDTGSQVLKQLGLIT